MGYNLQNLSQYFKGDTVTILAGNTKQRFLVHQEALNLSESSSLRTLVSGKWSESRNRVIDWGHTDADTVSRLCTFLYTGTYEVPHPTRRDNNLPPATTDESGEGLDGEVKADFAEEALAEPEPEPAPEPEPEEATVDEEAPVALEEEAPFAQSIRTESDSDLQRVLLQSFDARPLTPIRDIVSEPLVISSTTAFEITRYPYAEYYYAEVLLTHAKLYALAKYHLFPSLANLALRRLVETLDSVQSREEHAALEVAALANFVYEHVPAENADDEPLRKIVSHFVAMNFTLLERGDLIAALALGGDLTSDVIRKISRRLRAESEVLDALTQEVAGLRQEVANLRQRVPDRDVPEEPSAEPSGFGVSSARRRRR